MYLLVTARKGISSMQIAKEIGVQQKSAWFMLHRLREKRLTYARLIQ
jgi:Mn-dependent DtxR family transcriptional regulator